MTLFLFIITAFVCCWSFVPATANTLPVSIDLDSTILSGSRATHEKAVLRSRISRILSSFKRPLCTAASNRLPPLPADIENFMISPVSFHSVADCPAERYHFLFYRKLLLSHIVVRAGPEG
jgi:hypothetical protein